MLRSLLCTGCAQPILIDTSDWVSSALQHVLADREHHPDGELRVVDTAARFDAITRPLRHQRRYRWPS